MLHAWMMMLAPKVLPEPQPLSEPFTAHTHAHTHQQVIEYNNTKMLLPQFTLHVLCVYCGSN